MQATQLMIRPAEPADAHALAAVHAASWRFAYQGIIPTPTLEAMIAARGPEAWAAAARRPAPPWVAEARGGLLAGYVMFGLCRPPRFADGEIVELYCDPVFFGLGIGTRLFQAAAGRLAERGHRSMQVWALAANTPAHAFYRRMGGATYARSTEPIGASPLEKVAYLWRSLRVITHPATKL